jgi:creatinine amidohydrolase
VNYGYLAYPDIPENAVHLLPLGAVEPHGPHAPLVTDTLISIGISHRAAKRLEGEIPVLVLPPVHYGVTRYAAAFPGAVSITEDTLRSLVTEIAQSVEKIVLVNSHFEPEQVETLRSTGLPLLDLTRRRNAERLTDEFRSGSCHAGRYETSLVLADRPELVDREAMRSLPYVPVNLAAAIADGFAEFTAMGLDRAYCGSPAEATAEEGEEVFDLLAGMLVELARELVRGTGGRDGPGLFGRR